MTYILSLSQLRSTDLATAGGKGANLGELIAAGLPVPPGFCVLTPAYRAFVAANHLEEVISRECAAIDPADPDKPLAGAQNRLEAASAAIRTAFETAWIPGDLAEEIRTAYKNSGLSAQSVAVRSSATAEDLPDLSFAGQQDTYLNVVGEDDLLRAVTRCWASLWTARAIGYRARNDIPQADVALAVVVQAMIPSEAAGVLFTVDPLSGRRDRLVVDATLGLGEALVAGKVEPDHYVVQGERVMEKRLGAKALSIRGQVGGGTETVAETAGDRQALPDGAILQLAGLARRAAAHFGAPQDIEWSWSGERLWLVQSRPVTSLFPLPVLNGSIEATPVNPDRLLVWFNVGTFQGVMGPFTPLGRDLFRYLYTSIAGIFGSRARPDTQAVIYEAGERLFVEISGLMRNPVGRTISRAFLPAAEPGAFQALEPYYDDPRLAKQPLRWGLRTRLRLMRVMGPNLLRIAANLLFPAARRRRIQQKIERVVSRIRAEREAAAAAPLDPRKLVEFAEHTLAVMPPRMLLWLIGLVGSGQVAYQAGVRGLADQLPPSQGGVSPSKGGRPSSEGGSPPSQGGKPDSHRLGLEVMRGLEHNVTTEMDLELWQVSRVILRDPISLAIFQQRPAADLASDYQAGRLPAAAQAALGGFLARYGMRGVGEIDLGRRRWREDPAPVIQAVANYLRIGQSEAAPDAVFARGEQAAQAAIAEIVGGLRRVPGGWWKSRLAGWMANRARELAGLRETPKFTIIRIFGEMRTALLAAGETWARAGWLESPEDVAFLRIAELHRLAAQAWEGEARAKAGTLTDVDPAWSALVRERQAAYRREERRRQVPRLILGDGTTFYEGMSAAPGAPAAQDSAHVLVGSPVSPGQVEGLAHVVFDPVGAQLAPGEILVCAGTDPAWTPLFLAAGGLVTEVGGLMTHGSVVAREYGIPAVVGVGSATVRLQTGARIRVDGSAGTVTILD